MYFKRKTSKNNLGTNLAIISWLTTPTLFYNYYIHLSQEKSPRLDWGGLQLTNSALMLEVQCLAHYGQYSNILFENYDAFYRSKKERYDLKHKFGYKSLVTHPTV